MSVHLQIGTAAPLSIAAQEWESAEPTIASLKPFGLTVTVKRHSDDYQVQFEYEGYTRITVPIQLHCLLEDLGVHLRRPAKIHFRCADGLPEDFFIGPSPRDIHQAQRAELINRAAELLRGADAPVLATSAQQLAQTLQSGA